MWELFVRLLRWLQRVLIAYPECAFIELPDGRRQDVLLASSAEEAESTAAKLSFPESFTFGAATAAYQIEGGIGDTNWRRWEELKVRSDGEPTIADGQSAGAACDSWNRFDEDLRIIRELGLKRYRFSVEWSRVEPVEGQLDEAVVSFTPCKPTWYEADRAHSSGGTLR